jgi:hypothetical protein
MPVLPDSRRERESEAFTRGKREKCCSSRIVAKKRGGAGPHRAMRHSVFTGPSSGPGWIVGDTFLKNVYCLPGEPCLGRICYTRSKRTELSHAERGAGWDLRAPAQDIVGVGEDRPKALAARDLGQHKVTAYVWLIATLTVAEQAMGRQAFCQHTSNTVEM